MSRLTPSTKPRRERVRSGGRSARVRRRVATACLELLAEGQVDFGPIDVARRSGASRATIHRWWPTKEDLLREALAHHTRSLVVTDTGSWEGDVRALAQQLTVFFADPVEVSQNALMASGAHPEYTATVLDHYQQLFDEWRTMVARACARGEVAPDLDPDTVLLALASPLLLVPLLFRRSVSRREVEHLVTFLLKATSVRDL